MIKIEFQNDKIQIIIDQFIYEISQISQAYLVQQELKQYIENCNDESKILCGQGMLDLFAIAMNKLIHEQEFKSLCTKNWL